MSAHLRLQSLARVQCDAGRGRQRTLFRRLEATDSTLGAPLAVKGAGMIGLHALRVGSGCSDGISHGVPGAGQERQTQQRSDQQGEAQVGHRRDVAKEGGGQGKREHRQRAREVMLGGG